MDQKRQTLYQVVVHAETYERLLRRKQHPRESFNGVITRLLDKDTPGGDKE